MAIVQIARNAVIAKLINPERPIVASVNTLLSYTVDQGVGWSGKSSFYDVNSQTFPAGFVNVIQEELQKAGHVVQLVQSPLPQPLGPESPLVDEFGNDDPRYDYQITALRQVEKHGAGIIRVATGGGKSKIAKLIMARYARMTLFLTTRGILLYQMKDQLDANGTATGVVGDGQMSFVKEVNLGMVQTLVQALEETSIDKERRAIIKSLHGSKSKEAKAASTTHEEITRQATEAYERKTKRRAAIIRFLGLVEVVIGEEAHEAGGNSYYEILRHCKNARIRVALTATPFMRSSAEDNMRLMAAFGPVLIDIPESLLIERGILAKPFFKFRDAPPHPKLHRTSPYERAYTLGYIENDAMLRLMIADALQAKAHRLPTLTLVLRKAHGEAIQRAYAANGLNFVFLKGENDQEERRTYLGKLVRGEIDGIIGTTILDVGVDVPAIGLVQLAGGGKAEVALRQRIGRGLRSKKSGANIAFIADYSCNSNHTLWEHAKQRETIVRLTPGFVEGVLTDEEEFPWFRFAPAAQAA
jgi:superfamily II DNA or RNA helicase